MQGLRQAQPSDAWSGSRLRKRLRVGWPVGDSAARIPIYRDALPWRLFRESAGSEGDITWFPLFPIKLAADTTLGAAIRECRFPGHASETRVSFRLSGNPGANFRSDWKLPPATSSSCPRG